MVKRASRKSVNTDVLIKLAIIDADFIVLV